MRGTFKKISYVAVPLITVVAGSLAYLKFSSPSAQQVVAQQVPQQMKIDLPNGTILIPAGDGICRMHALDNATGQITDYGVVKCSNASKENLEAWMRATSKDRFVEIGKSFRHESDR
jgi:hypothetical protein